VNSKKILILIKGKKFFPQERKTPPKPINSIQKTDTKKPCGGFLKKNIMIFSVFSGVLLIIWIFFLLKG
jgi:hypothetical protein